MVRRVLVALVLGASPVAAAPAADPRALPGGVALGTQEEAAASLLRAGASLTVDAWFFGFIAGRLSSPLFKTSQFVAIRATPEGPRVVRLTDGWAQEGWLDDRWAEVVPVGELLVGVLELQYGFPSHERIDFIVTADRGRSWRDLSSLKKPRYDARYVDLTLRRDGVGVLTLWVPPYQRVPPELVPGFYAYTTRDFGRTWSEPTISPGEEPRERLERSHEVRDVATLVARLGG